MRALLVHNPTAGSGRPTGEELLEALDKIGFSTTYCSSKKNNIEQALKQKPDIVIVAGGDGTLGKVARALEDRKTLVGILPFGTANNVARYLGLKGKPEEIIKSLRGAPVKRLDIGKAAGPWGTRRFLESVGWGALAKAVNRDDLKVSKHERIERGRAAFADALAKPAKKLVRLTADDNKIEGEFLFVEVLNIGMTGPRMLLGPTAQHEDQLFDVVYLAEEHRQDMLDWLATDPDDRPPPLEARKARKVTLVWDHGPLRVDDQVFSEPELASNIIMEIEPHGLRVCVPEVPQ